MYITKEQVEKVLSGKAQCRFNQLGFSMLVTRLMGVYKKNPSKDMLEKCTAEINEFISKFASLMKPDYELFSKL